MTAATIVFLGLLFVGFIGCAICGNLSRFADAVEAQNKHYGIGEPTIVDLDELRKKKA